LKFKEKLAGKEQPAAPAVAETSHAPSGFGFGSFFASAAAATTTTTTEVSRLMIVVPVAGGRYCFDCRLFVCLSISTMTRKVMGGFL